MSRHRRRYPGTAHLISYCVLIKWFLSSHFTHKFFNLFLTILWYKFKWTGLWGELALEKTFKLARSVARWTWGLQCLVTGVATQVYDLVDRPRAMDV